MSDLDGSLGSAGGDSVGLGAYLKSLFGNRLGSYTAFYKELPNNFNNTRAIIPTSSYSGAVLASPMDDTNKPLRVLEVGCGTGPITAQILKKLGPKDTLVLCEKNESFMAHLRKSISKNPKYSSLLSQVTFFDGGAEELLAKYGENSFDVIVCSLPFTSFSPEFVNDIFIQFTTLLVDNGKMTFIEYVGLRKVNAMLLKDEGKKRVEAVEEMIQQWCKKAKKVEEMVVMRNIPPALIFKATF